MMHRQLSQILRAAPTITKSAHTPFLLTKRLLSSTLLRGQTQSLSSSINNHLQPTNTVFLNLLRGAKTAARHVPRKGANRLFSDAELSADSNLDTRFKVKGVLPIGTYFIYKSRYPKLHIWAWVFAGFVMFSHIMMIPELAKQEYFGFMSENVWNGVVIAELCIVFGFFFFLLVRRQAIAISCTVTNPTQFPETVTIFTPPFMGFKSDWLLPLRSIAGVPQYSRSDKMNQDLTIDLGLVKKGHVIRLSRKGYYHPETQILAAVLGMPVEKLLGDGAELDERLREPIEGDTKYQAIR